MADQEDATRRAVEEAERLRAMQLDAQRAATEQAARALSEEQRLSTARGEAFARLKKAEAEVEEMAARLRDLNQRRAEVRNRIAGREALLTSLIPIILRMQRYPIETLLATRLPAEDAIRGYLIVRGIARQAQEDAKGLEADRAALDAASQAAAAVEPKLAAAQSTRAAEAESVAEQLAEAKARREAAEQEATEAARRAAAEAARQTSLRSMLQILEIQRRLEEAKAREDVLRADRDQKSAAADAARARQAAVSHPTGAGTLTAGAKPSGQLTPPAAGTLLRGWGDPDNGEPATGQTWRTAAGARVVAPCGGTVAFAEAFHGYGLLVIIDCGGGFHTVLSGLDQLSVVPGQTVQDGDKVGVMRAETRTASTDGGALGPPVLYVELRKGGRPVDPSPWLRPGG